MPIGCPNRFPNQAARASHTNALFFQDDSKLLIVLHVIAMVQHIRWSFCKRFAPTIQSQEGGEMHGPDGFLNAATAVATGAISAGTIGASIRQARTTLTDKQIPLAGLAAAFIFAAQMFNFPVAAGTTGHLLGGTLAAILLGPSVGAIVVTIVVIVQAVAFADGGLTALGYNVLNMAIVTAFGGWAAYRLFRKIFPNSAAGVVAATGLAGGFSVVLSAAAFSVGWLFGANTPVPFDTVFGAMVGAHLLIGVGEGVISGMAVGAVLAARPDLVYGARDLDRSQLANRKALSTRTFLISGFGVVLLLAVIVSQFTADGLDGLERVAADTGITATTQESMPSIFADYATEGIGNESLSLAVAGASGAIITLLVGAGLFSAVRLQKPRDKAMV